MGGNAGLEQDLYIPDKIVLNPRQLSIYMYYWSGLNNAHGIIWNS